MSKHRPDSVEAQGYRDRRAWYVTMQLYSIRWIRVTTTATAHNLITECITQSQQEQMHLQQLQPLPDKSSPYPPLQAAFPPLVLSPLSVYPHLVQMQ